jgi:ribosomal protein S18
VFKYRGPCVFKFSLAFSTDSKPTTPSSTPRQPVKGKAPDNFYDDSVESEKEFLDVTTVLLRDGGIGLLSRVQNPLTWKEIEKFENKTVDLRAFADEVSEEVMEAAEDEKERAERENHEYLYTKEATTITNTLAATDLGNHLDKFVNSYVPEEYVNYTMPWKDDDGIEDPLLDKFVPNTAQERFTYSTQGNRACVGKLQRRGKTNVLNCHLIDLDELHHLDVVNLKRFLSDDAEILGRRQTGLCSKCQRKVAKCVKTSRQLGILPHIGQYFVEDSRPSHVDENFHDVVEGAERVESKTVF